MQFHLAPWVKDQGPVAGVGEGGGGHAGFPRPATSVTTDYLLLISDSSTVQQSSAKRRLFCSCAVPWGATCDVSSLPAFVPYVTKHSAHSHRLLGIKASAGLVG